MTDESKKGIEVKEIKLSKEGGFLTYLKGLKYPLKGCPGSIAVNVILPIVKKFFPLPKNYCKSVKELYRVMTIAEERCIDQSVKEKIRKTRDFICPLLELDDVYRYIAQDMFEITKIEFLLPDEGDKYFMKRKSEIYDFGGKSNKGRENKSN